MIKIFKNKKRLALTEIFLVIVLITLGIVSRFLPHPFNFTSIAAIALFGGAYLSLGIGLVLPIIALFISDYFIGFYEPVLMIFVYLCFALCGLIGYFLKKKKTWYTIGFASITSSLIFFIITNFSVWAFTPWYEKTLAGLAKCYTLAIPFFRNSLMGDLFYTAVLFGAYELIAYVLRKTFILIKEKAS